jgi:hypothetical protein
MSKINNQLQIAWMNKKNNLLKRGPLVYAGTLKNASTYFHNLLTLNQFVPISFDQVNWEQDHVFGFIQDPWKRRAKGIAEDLLTHYSCEQYLLNNLGHRFWVDHLTFGEHSIPLTLTWHSKVEDIDWIPLDCPDVDAVEMLKKLFENYSLTLDVPVNLEKHQTDFYKKEVYDQISKFINNGSASLHLMLAKDSDLYNTVICNFNAYESQWNHISWLKYKTVKT